MESIQFFYVYLLSFNMFICMLLYVNVICSFALFCYIPLYKYTVLHPFYCYWTFELFHLAITKNAAMNIFVYMCILFCQGIIRVEKGQLSYIQL